MNGLHAEGKTKFLFIIMKKLETFPLSVNTPDSLYLVNTLKSDTGF